MTVHYPSIILECATAFCETFIVYLYLRSCFTITASRIHWAVSYLLLFIAHAALSVAAPVPLTLITFTFVSVLALAVLLYQGEFLKKVFAALFFCGLMAASEIICGGIVALLSGIAFRETKVFGDQRLLGDILAKFVQFLIVNLVGDYFKRKRNLARVALTRLLPLFACQLFSMILTYYIFVTGYIRDDGLTSVAIAITTGILA